MSNLGTMMAGGKPRKRERSAADFYPTPPEAAWPFLEAVAPVIGERMVWEPSCGDGVLARTMQAAGLRVIGTDLHEYGWQEQAQVADFLGYVVPLAPVVVTNPPFVHAARFIEHALGRLKVAGLGLLLKATFWHAGERVGLWRRFPPAAVFPLAWRVDFTGDGGSTMDLSWFWWGGSPVIAAGPLERPKALPPELHGVWSPPVAFGTARPRLQGALAI